MRIVLDTNIWISFLIGKSLAHIDQIFDKGELQLFVCPQLLKEIDRILQKPKLQRYITDERRQALFKLIATCRNIEVEPNASISRDVNDNYLLDLSMTAKADFLITGDKDLLVLKDYFNTKIVTFSDFLPCLLTAEQSQLSLSEERHN